MPGVVSRGASLQSLRINNYGGGGDELKWK